MPHACGRYACHRFPHVPRQVQVAALKLAIRNERRIYLMLVRAWERKMVQWRNSFSVRRPHQRRLPSAARQRLTAVPRRRRTL